MNNFDPMNPTDLATEILQDLKKEAKRKQIIIYILIGVIIFLVLLGTIERAMWDYSTVLVDAEDGNANYIGQDGNIVNGEDNRENEDTEKSVTWEAQETQD